MIVAVDAAVDLQGHGGFSFGDVLELDLREGEAVQRVRQPGFAKLHTRTFRVGQNREIGEMTVEHCLGGSDQQGRPGFHRAQVEN
jgi:hypothetical protein